MGILENFAIKQSCTEISRKILIYFKAYTLENANEDDKFDIIFLNALHKFTLTDPTFKMLCPTFNPSKYTDWSELYIFILFVGVKTDLAHYLNLETVEHFSLIRKIAFKELEEFIKRECR